MKLIPKETIYFYLYQKLKIIRHKLKLFVYYIEFWNLAILSLVLSMNMKHITDRKWNFLTLLKVLLFWESYLHNRYILLKLPQFLRKWDVTKSRIWPSLPVFVCEYPLFLIIIKYNFPSGEKTYRWNNYEILCTLTADIKQK